MTNETATASRSIQVWPSGEMFRYCGDIHSGNVLIYHKESDDFIPATPEEFGKIYVSELAEIYAQRDVLSCQSSLIDTLLRSACEASPADDLSAFDSDCIRNQFRPRLDSDRFRVYFAVINMPGFMPDEPPHPYPTAEQARAGLLEALENHIDETEDERDERGRFTDRGGKAKAAINSDCTGYFNGYAYAVSEDCLTREELEDNYTESEIDDDFECIDSDEPWDEPREIYEWWLVSDWLADKLEEIGEPVIRNGFGDWWGRTCTGQGFLMDGTLQAIAREFLPETETAEA